MSRLRCSGAPSLVSPISYSYCMTQTKHEVNQSLHRLRASDGRVCVCAHHTSLSYLSIANALDTHDRLDPSIYLSICTSPLAILLTMYASLCLSPSTVDHRRHCLYHRCCLLVCVTLCVCERDSERQNGCIRNQRLARDSLTQILTQILTH